MQPFKRIVLSLKNGLINEEINIEGYGLAVLKTFPEVRIKFDDKLNDDIPLSNIQSGFRFHFDKIYISSPKYDENLELLFFLDDKTFFDVKSNEEYNNKLIMRQNEFFSNTVQRGNDFDFRVLNSDVESALFIRDSDICPIIFISIIGNTDNWQIIAELKNRNVKEFPAEILKNNSVSINLKSVLFKPLPGAEEIKVYIEYMVV